MYDIYIFPWKDDDGKEKSCLVISEFGKWKPKDMKYNQVDMDECYIHTTSFHYNELFPIIIKMIGNTPDALPPYQFFERLRDYLKPDHNVSMHRKFKMNINEFEACLWAHGCKQIINDDITRGYIIPLQKETVLDSLRNYYD